LAGYANRLITLTFDELSEDPENDPIRLTIRNPRLMPPDELRPKGVDSENEDEVMAATYEVMARLVVGWRVYDASAPIEVDENGDVVEGADQPRLALPATAESVAKLPMEIINRIGGEIREAADPQ
jgi:hypothetical protein